MRLYLAGSYSNRLRVRDLSAHIAKEIDCRIVSRWHDQGEESEEIARLGHQHFINIDLHDVDHCNVFVLLNHPHYSTPDSPGKWVEVGYALARRKLIVNYGAQRECLFVHDRSVITLPSNEDADLIELLKAIQKTVDCVQQPSLSHLDAPMVEPTPTGVPEVVHRTRPSEVAATHYGDPAWLADYYQGLADEFRRQAARTPDPATPAPTGAPDPRLLTIAGLVNAYYNDDDGTILTAGETVRAIADALGPLPASDGDGGERERT